MQRAISLGCDIRLDGPELVAAAEGRGTPVIIYLVNKWCWVDLGLYEPRPGGSWHHDRDPYTFAYKTMRN